MENKLDPEILKIIICPFCHEKIDAGNSKIVCGSCNAQYKVSTKGQPDLRLVKEKDYKERTALVNKLIGIYKV